MFRRDDVGRDPHIGLRPSRVNSSNSANKNLKIELLDDLTNAKDNRISAGGKKVTNANIDHLKGCLD